MLHLESLSVEFTHILVIFDNVEVVHQVKKLSVFFVIFERSDGNPVRKLRAERVNSIVNDDHVLHLPVFEYSQIFDINIVCRLDAVVSVHTVLDQGLVRVYMVQDHVRVPTMTCCEDNNFEVLIYHFQAFARVGADIEAGSVGFARHQINV